MDPQFESIAALISACIDEVSAANMFETAELLRMAQIDLIARANGISEEELDLIGRLLQAG